MRQRPSSASGVVFLTLEDETGNINVLVWTSVLERYRSELLQGQLLQIKGTVEREGEVIHVIAGHVIDHTELLGTLAETPATTHAASCHATFTNGPIRPRSNYARLRFDNSLTFARCAFTSRTNSIKQRTNLAPTHP